MAQSGYTPILIYASGTATNVPLAADMTSTATGAELAINYADGKLYYKNSSNVVTLLASTSGASGDVVGPASATDNALARFDLTTGKLIQNSVGILSDAGILTGLTGITSSGSITLSSLTSGRVTYAGTAGLLQDSANLTFNGTTLTANTIGAYTLSGTIAGGGNQINNVIIGTSTPLAGSFTSVTATSITNSGLTSGRVVYTTTGGLETSSANLLYSGTDLTVYGLTVGRGGGAVATNTAVGASALANNSSGSNSTAFGYLALNAEVTNFENNAFGANAGKLTTSSRNNFFGSYAGQSNTSGADICAIGHNALGANITGSQNTALGGGGPLSSNISGSSNTGLGHAALYSNTTASNNTAVGYQALYASTAGYNTAVGYQAGAANTTGFVTAIGTSALRNNTTGASNTAVGNTTLLANTTGNYNIGIGDYALQANTTASGNTAVGYEALYSNTTASYNVAVGTYALRTSSTGKGNVAVGYAALYANTLGQSNTAIGSYDGDFDNPPMRYNTTGSYNIAVGTGALWANTTASNNTAVGYQAGYSNTTGRVEAFGYQTLYSNTTGSSNVAFGAQAGYNNTTGGNNTFMGLASGFANTTASNNTAVGYQAAYSNTTGTALQAFGRNALYSNTTGVANVAIGGEYVGNSVSALSGNSTGSYNIAVGTGALGSNTTASNNTAVGYQAGYSNTTGSGNSIFGQTAGYNSNGTNNTIIGFQSGYNVTGARNTIVGYDAGFSLTSGTNNTFVGGADNGNLGAGYYVTTGSKNTILGAYSGNSGGLDIRTASNYIVLSDGDGNPRGFFNSVGNFLVGTTTDLIWNTTNLTGCVIGGNASSSGYSSIQVSRANDICLLLNRLNDDGQIATFARQGTSVGSISVTTTATAYNTSSDYRLKENIVPMTGALAIVAQLKPVTYKWKSDGSDGQGFIAHELQAVVPQCVDGEKDAVHKDGKPKYQGVDTSFLVATLVSAIQELKAEFDAYKATHP